MEIVEGQRNRYWMGYDVDSELKDKWLEDLNTLPGAILTSVCYGHPTEENDNRAGGSPNASIVIVLQDGDIEKISKKVFSEVKQLKDVKVDMSWYNSGNNTVKLPNGKVIGTGGVSHTNGRPRKSYVFSDKYWDDYKNGRTKTVSASININCRLRTDDYEPMASGNRKEIDNWFEATIKGLYKILSKYYE